MSEILYTTSAISTGEGRDGHVRSEDGTLDLDLALAKELGGRGGKTNPEQLFAAGYAACFHSAMKFVAAQQKIKLGESTVTAQVSMLPRSDEGFMLSVALRVEIAGIEHDAADALVAKAHQVCPYSHATKGNIDVTVEAKAV